MKDEERIKLRLYLLGRLDEPEREALAERYFVDEELFDELLEAENVLFSQYVRDELPAADKKHFAKYINGLPDGKFKLAAATALAKSATVQADHLAASSEKNANIVSIWQTIRGFFLGGRLVPQYALGGMILLTLGLAAYFYLRQATDGNETERIQATQTEQNIPNRNQPLTNPSPEQNDQPPVPPPKEKPERAELPKENIDKEVPNKKPPTVSTLASFILSPALRSENAADKLALKPETKIISLTVKLPPNEKAETFRAVLQLNEGTGPIVLTKDNLKPRGAPQKRHVRLTVPAQKMTGSSYKLTLQGLVENQIETMPEYYFEIIKQ